MAPYADTALTTLTLSLCLSVCPSHATHTHTRMYVMYNYKHAHKLCVAFSCSTSVPCLHFSWLFLSKWMRCYGSRELANQSSGCFSLLEIAVKNQLPDCTAVNHMIGRDVRRAAVLILESASWERTRVMTLFPSGSGSVCVARAVTPAASPMILKPTMKFSFQSCTYVFCPKGNNSSACLSWLSHKL